jgi:hypothetical protein
MRSVLAQAAQGAAARANSSFEFGESAPRQLTFSSEHLPNQRSP